MSFSPKGDAFFSMGTYSSKDVNIVGILDGIISGEA